VTLNPIFASAARSTRSRPSNTNAGFFIWSYTRCQSISRNSFHSVAITIASAPVQASMADGVMVTCFLTVDGRSISLESNPEGIDVVDYVRREWDHNEGREDETSKDGSSKKKQSSNRKGRNTSTPERSNNTYSGPATCAVRPQRDQARSGPR
jgi:hypothetical protein